MDPDIYGKGLLSFVNGDENAFFTVESNRAETEEWPVALFFRDYGEMPDAERIALDRAQGEILDVGAGAGSHTLFLQNQGKKVTAMDLSPGAAEAMRRRGVQNVVCEDFFRYNGNRFDTLLFLMNGIGIAGTLNRVPLFLEKARSILRPGGKIVLDSSDILYLYEEEDGSVLLDLNAPYYGELEYRFLFSGEMGDCFEWLFIDYGTLAGYAHQYGFSCRKLYEDDHYLYLAELIKTGE